MAAFILDWLARSEGELVVDPIILGELCFGILLLADLRAAGRAMPIKDSLIAATALTYDLVIATLDTRDFTAAGVQLIDPSGDT